MISAFLRCLMILVAAMAVGLLLIVVGAFAEEGDCPVPERFYEFQPILTKTAKALAGRREVGIVALGGSSTLGGAAGGLEFAWPARLAVALGERFPSARTKVINLAVGRQTAKQAVERLDHDVLPLKPTLVIWETGTMEAVRSTDVDEFRQTLQAGIDKLRAAGAEVVLMSMQFSRATETVIHFGPYVAALREVADVNDVPLFRRRGIMRYWAQSGALDLRAGDGEKSRELAGKLYDCIGRAMAEFVARSVPAAKRANSPGGDR
jgi:GDSL-like lipase/acylhydrolase family protein